MSMQVLQSSTVKHRRVDAKEEPLVCETLDYSRTSLISPESLSGLLSKLSIAPSKASSRRPSRAIITLNLDFCGLTRDSASILQREVTTANFPTLRALHLVGNFRDTFTPGMGFSGIATSHEANDLLTVLCDMWERHGCLALVTIDPWIARHSKRYQETKNKLDGRRVCFTSPNPMSGSNATRSARLESSKNPLTPSFVGIKPAAAPPPDRDSRLKRSLTEGHVDRVTAMIDLEAELRALLVNKEVETFSSIESKHRRRLQRLDKQQA